MRNSKWRSRGPEQRVVDESLPSFRGPAEGRFGHYPWIEANKSVYGSVLGENLSETIVDKKFPQGRWA